jgi:hypothetical protein
VIAARRCPLVIAAALLASCAHLEPRSTGPTLELALDDGHPSERPLTPTKTFEMLMKFDPKLPAFTARQLRFLLAQPGRILFTVYDTTPDGRPGNPLATVDRDYPASFVSDGKDGRWVIEPLELPSQHGPLFVGIQSPSGGPSGDPRLWASSVDTKQVFQRDADPNVPLTATTIPRTPILRLEISP